MLKEKVISKSPKGKENKKRGRVFHGKGREDANSEMEDSGCSMSCDMNLENGSGMPSLTSLGTMLLST